MATFMDRIRSGSIDYVLFVALAQENVADLTPPYTLTQMEEALNVTAAQSDQMQMLINVLPPGGAIPPNILQGVLKLAKDGIDGYTTDTEIYNRLGIVP